MERLIKFGITCSILLGISLTFTSCKTKDDVVREQQLGRLQQEVRAARAGNASSEQFRDEIRMELTRLSSLVDAQARKIEMLETKLDSQKNTPPPAPKQAQAAAPAVQTSFAAGKNYFDKGQYVRAMATLKRYLQSAPSNSPTREKAQFLLAESYFANKDYTFAALEYNKYKQNYPKTSSVPTATYRQALSFQSLGRKAEAKLFFEELIDRYPKHPLSKRARKALKSL